ncbi:hypothetical protein NPIL_405571 [Nephila pilipes]|uniref:Uncharacterized protein n=1 Tax=Nephila pilipes TaxID=299642 RepID=A0A8X6PJ30_NEPPI|nr:hypothetical protein NPIL_405571 [Nephila pilipes]
MCSKTYHHPSIHCLRNSPRQPFRGFSSLGGNPFQTEVINLRTKVETPPDTKQKKGRKKNCEGRPADRGSPAKCQRPSKRKFRNDDPIPRGQLPGFSFLGDSCESEPQNE